MLKLLATTALALTASMAQAATVTEADYGGFSNSGWSWATNSSAFSEIGHGYSSVSGTGEQNRHDFLHFTGLPTGEQSVTISFGFVPDATANNRDVSVYWGTAAFCDWCGTGLPQVSMNAGNPTTEYVLNFNAGFAGDLYLQLNFLSGTNFTYNITGTGFASDSASGSAPAVPLPAGIWLGLSALGALGLAARRRKA
ncbi:VPLPA-CTERM sorting domain-containing protein [Pseudooceanicola sp.]|uniref:VPLPA-CTERM sorting domain-containing protein n=1 Tax=Pseudooceanicola sp. TaxID=1914328 RepID=UPI0035C6A01E